MKRHKNSIQFDFLTPIKILSILDYLYFIVRICQYKEIRITSQMLYLSTYIPIYSVILYDYDIKKNVCNIWKTFSFLRFDEMKYVISSRQKTWNQINANNLIFRWFLNTRSLGTAVDLQKKNTLADEIINKCMQKAKLWIWDEN